MELIINKDSKVAPRKSRLFETVITFYVHGGNDVKEVQSFHESKLENPNFKNEVEDFILSIRECVALDKGGRGGINNTSKLINRYSKSKTWLKMCYTALENLDDSEYEEYGIDPDAQTFTNLHYYIPSNDVGFYASYSAFDIFYYDENGDKFTVTPVWNIREEVKL